MRVASVAGGYIGFQFDPTGSQKLYGWAEVVFTATGASGTFEVVQWAYDDTGANLQAVQTAVPEPALTPAALGLLALGAADVRRWRGSNRD